MKTPQECISWISKIGPRTSTDDNEYLTAIKHYLTTNNRTGNWLDSCPTVSDGELYRSWVCSKCDNRVLVRTTYCSHCGARNIQ